MTTDDQLSVPRQRRLSAALVCTALTAAVIGSVGAPLITPVATSLHVSLSAAQWTLTVTLFTGAIASPVIGRLGSGPSRRRTIVVVLGLVVVGGVLTAVPLPFVVLLIGRGLQGFGIAVIPLLMSVARSHLPSDRAASTIAALSVASTVGIGVGYPVISLADQIAGLRAAYLLGLVLSIAGVIVAWCALPAEEPGTNPSIDVTGAVLLALGTVGILVVVSEPSLWSTPWHAAVVLVAAVVILAVWVVVEMRTAQPLVDLRLLGRGSVVRANAAMLIAGVGLYVLFSLFTRYVQTPGDAGYGFALPGVAAGAALIPFSLLGFVAGKVLPSLAVRVTASGAYGVSAVVGIAATAVFAGASGSFIAVVVGIALLGFAVGGMSAVMPQLVLVGVPTSETASVLSILQIVRSIGFSLGSALAGLLLAANTPSGSTLPLRGGYTTAVLCAVPFLLASALMVSVRGRGRVA